MIAGVAARRPLTCGFCESGRRESNPRSQFGRLGAKLWIYLTDNLFVQVRGFRSGPLRFVGARTSPLWVSRESHAAYGSLQRFSSRSITSSRALCSPTAPEPAPMRSVR